MEKTVLTVVFQPFGKRVSVPFGTTLSSAAAANGIPLAADCGGNGSCGRCLVEVSTSSRPGTSPKKVLACRHEVRRDLIVTVPAASLLPSQKLNLESRGKPPRPDGRESAAPGLLGVAIDLGSTKIAAYLHELDTGAQLAQLGAMNPQIAFGEDVVARLAFASQGADNAALLSKLTIDALNEMIRELLAVAGKDRSRLSNLVLVGNPAMTHLLLGLSVATLARAPYRPVTVEPTDIDASSLGFEAGDGARFEIPGAIGGFVGADHVAMILGSGIDRARMPVLGIDIGTNTEIVLADPARGILLCASCASGPAFEGAHIAHGIRAASGAVDRVAVRKGRVFAHTIDDQPATGICGSGLVDAVAALLKLGFLDRNGRLSREADPKAESPGERRWVLVDSARSASGGPIHLSQGDITRLQLAKAAVQAGVKALLACAGTDPREIRKIILAGGFGSYLNPASARAIGLIPDFPNARTAQVGNAAGIGAKALLLSRKAASRAASLHRRAEHIDLASDPRFNRLFAQALKFS